MVETIMKNNYESEDEKPPRHSEVGQIKDLQQTLNLTNAFLMLLVLSYVRSCFKLLRMSWYKIIKQFRTNLKLVIKTHLCGSQ